MEQLPKFTFLIPPLVEGQVPKMYRWDPYDLGIAYLIAALKKMGINATVDDYSNSTLKELITQLKANKPDFIGMTLYTKKVNTIKYIAKVIKKYSPQTIIVAGGPHITAIPEDAMVEIPEIDVGVIGEGEITLPDLLQNFNNLEAVRGIIFREHDSNNLIKTKPREFIQNLDEIPFPAWDSFNIHSKLPYGDIFTLKKIELPVLTQRGCPFHCSFCLRFMGNEVRIRSVENVIAELQYNVEKFHMTHVMFLDETFNVSRKRTIQLCKEIIRTGLNKKIKWGCFNRVSTTDEKLLQLMREAGCHFMEFGIDSGLDSTLRNIKKGNTFLQEKQAVRLATKYRLKPYLSVIFGHPLQTLADAQQDLKNVLSLRGFFYQFCKLIPFPGTEIYRWAVEGKHGLIIASKDWNKYDAQLGGALQSKFFSASNLDKFHKIAYIRMFLQLFPGSFIHVFSIINFRNFFLYQFRRIVTKKL